MPLGTADLAWVRSKVGPAPDDAQLDEIYNRVGAREEVVREVLDARLAALVAKPAQFSVPGEYSQDVSANINALRAAVREVESSPTVNTSRPDPLPQR